MTLEVVRDGLAVSHFLRGNKLANGALCIAAAPHRYEGEYVVLAFRDHPVDCYVVWYSDSEGNCHQGDYCTTLVQAMARFEKRAGVSA